MRARTSNPMCRTPSTKSSMSQGVRQPTGALNERRMAIPPPFHLAFVEIGNEEYHDQSGTYDARFAQFYKAIKPAHPEI